MPPFDSYDDDDVFAGSSTRLMPPKSAIALRRSPSRQSIHVRRSTASLRGSSSLVQALDAEDSGNGNGRHSLAHELAFALMPEPSAGSKLLAEEFGIEYDEGAEGIDGEGEREADVSVMLDGSSFADELAQAEVLDASLDDPPSITTIDEPPVIDPTFGSPTPARRRSKKQPEQDAMDVLAQDLETTEKFISHLRRLDADAVVSPSQPGLEKIASDVIRRINETARDREGQVRELLEYEREFRKIAGEVGGNDALGHLDELESVDDLVDQPTSTDAHRADDRRLTSVVEESLPTSQVLNDWEMDPDRNHLGDEDDESEPDTPLPTKDTFPPPPSVTGPISPAKTIPQLAHLRTFTASLVTSLTAISEHAQVNGAATADAGRKIRALKNKLGGWRTEWDSAEQSRLRIERWEAGLADGDVLTNGSPVTPPRSPGLRKRPDGRKIVEEHLRGFERALMEASLKTKAIMAVS
ncbi:hypothetical protein JAAARDRAFT_30764 [Jaapia argillacea MUCL 33604]|uniref:Uncharacterized protein n=1 Tax=Jaapia argillacea MUCL 33604 TaxID=933084 RepID=A0A067QCV3_9AGAM|nr:hypothetical protein JAAARDRAFT_30764 [Jaapia argillacea MUCL 33604]